MNRSTPRLRWLALLGASIGLTAGGCQTLDPDPHAMPSPARLAPTQATPSQLSLAPSRPTVTARPGGVVPAAASEPATDPKDTPSPQAGVEKGDDAPLPLAPTPGLSPTAAAPIDLASALAQAGVDNPTIALARERVRESVARQTAARSLLLPTLAAGVNVRIHSGAVQRAGGTISDVNLQSVYFGSGAQAAGTGTVGIPGVRLFAHLGDAALEPRAAGQRVAARSADAVATQNRTLLAVAVGYVELVGADAKLEALRQGETELGEIVRLTAAYARTGQGRLADANRASANADLVRRQRQDAEGEAAVASARLAALFSADPSTRLTPIPGPLAPVALVDEAAALEDHIALALAARPERRARWAEVAEARTRVRQEEVRPWLPTLSVGFSSGGFGGGTDQFGAASARTDFDVSAVWTVQNLGFGNRALQRQTGARVGQAIADLVRTENDIRREVSEALAAATATNVQIAAARKALSAAEEGAAEELKRIKAEVGRPLEALDSVRQLIEARLELVRAVTEYNAAQFRLWVAVGTTPVAPAVQRSSR